MSDMNTDEPGANSAESEADPTTLEVLRTLKRELTAALKDRSTPASALGGISRELRAVIAELDELEAAAPKPPATDEPDTPKGGTLAAIRHGFRGPVGRAAP